MNKKEFGRLINAARQRAHLTQERLAELIGEQLGVEVRQQNVQQWSSGQYLPLDRATLLSLLSVLYMREGFTSYSEIEAILRAADNGALHDDELVRYFPGLRRLDTPPNNMDTNSQDINSFQYDVALSFAGEDRGVADSLARLLRSRGIKVFYDQFEQADLWGKNLYDHLADVYANRARYCIMLISSHYAKKLWTNHEREHAQARAFTENQEYILPVKLDNTSIPGLPATIGYIDLRNSSVEQVTEYVTKKLDNAAPQPRGTSSNRQPNLQRLDIPVPKIKKTFSQRDRDRFLRVAFEFIKHYFQDALTQLEAHYADIETDFIEVHTQKFVSRVYLQGSLKSQCKIWVGRPLSSESINYSEGMFDVNNDNSLNGYIIVDDDGSDLGLKIANFGLSFSSPTLALSSPEQAAEQLWRRHTAYLG
jgi:transcriptional regulator with XRE-family HTH domain